ncbi:hypothetical protein [Acidianus ambivalens]|uniref:Uncharacterized protein n=1 Tax=Acidianus ambivalens TaxID=2283 RepID=A0A650CU40_ACIAM|nr:hypothetical protein [Acidianus ambivalens]MQL56139.1 hypothetical protein [Acidianus ambivalens]QGR21318.1 hypothetical protein D1866_04410 [Acidianus ambivalens]
MMEEKEVVLKALEKVDKWYVQLAGIKGDELLIVSQKEVPKEIEVEGRKLTVKHYSPEEYLNVITKDENEFRSYHVYYFVKMYMRKVLDLLAYLEVNRIRIDEKDLL